MRIKRQGPSKDGGVTRLEVCQVLMIATYSELSEKTSPRRFTCFRVPPQNSSYFYHVSSCESNLFTSLGLMSIA